MQSYMYSPTLNTSKEGREIGSIRPGFLVCMEKRKGPGNTSCPHTFWIINRLFARPLVSLSDVDLLFSSFFRSFDFSHIVIIPWGALFWVPPHMTQPRPHLYLFSFYYYLPHRVTFFLACPKNWNTFDSVTHLKMIQISRHRFY